MASLPLFSQWNIPPERLQELYKYAAPTGIADYAALAVIAGVSAGYLSRGILWDQPDPYHHLAFERPQLKYGGQTGANANKETRNIAQKLEETGKNIVVFWGSQSGTAEGFAHRLAREISIRWGQESMTADLSDYDPATITEIPNTKLAIFIVSTYGEGDPSDNTADFWSWITKAGEISLTNLRYVAFGLGNTNYKFYNRVVDVVVEGLEKFGAKALMPVGKANDAEGATEEDFMAWKDGLFEVFKQQLGFQEVEAKYTPSLMVQEDESLEPIDLHHGEPNSHVDAPKSAAQSSAVRTLNISSSRELFTSSDRNCLHMDLDLSNQPELTYKTGDHLAIWPGNPDAEVERLLEVLGISSRRDIPLHIKSVDSATKNTIPSPTSAIALFRYYLEICAPVNRDNIRDLAQFAPTQESKTYLLRLGQDKTAYADFINRTHINLGRLLQLACPDKSWSDLPLSYLVETLPHIRPRFYSISSSSVVSPRKPSITAIVSSTPLSDNPNELVHGVTSNYLLAISQHSRSQAHPHGITYHLNGPSDALKDGKVFAHIRRSKFKLPITGKTPLIMVGAGTGLAPFRAFLSERCQVQKIGKEIGHMILFFGCRNPDEDFIYRDELEEMQKILGDKLRLVTAFSRQEGSPRRYVQDRVSELGDDVVGLIDEGASFYVCGRAGMAREVEKVVGKTMQKAKGWTEDEVNNWSKAVKKKNKWQEDVWG
jgi:NADPH-ferrihemoprotein reductase